MVRVAPFFLTHSVLYYTTTSTIFSFCLTGFLFWIYCIRGRVRQLFLVHNHVVCSFLALLLHCNVHRIVSCYTAVLRKTSSTIQRKMFTKHTPHASHRQHALPSPPSPTAATEWCRLRLDDDDVICSVRDALQHTVNRDDAHVSRFCPW